MSTSIKGRFTSYGIPAALLRLRRNRTAYITCSSLLPPSAEGGCAQRHGWSRSLASPTGDMGRRFASLLLALVLLVSLGGCGITAPRSNEGYADLDSLGMMDTDRVISLSLGPAVLHFAASFIDDDPEVRDLLRSLDGVRVRVYEVNGDASKVAGRMQHMSSKMQEDGWEPVMLVRQEDEQTHMLMRMVDDEIRGMTVLVLDGDTEAVIVNLMGDIKPEQFGDVMVALDVDSGDVDEVELDESSVNEGVVTQG